MVTDWQKLPKFVALIGFFFLFNWVLHILILKSVSAFDTTWLCFFAGTAFLTLADGAKQAGPVGCSSIYPSTSHLRIIYS